MPSADRGAGPNGLAVVDKPAGWTSHDVVAKSRGILGTKKVGHSGTLDPDATGVLLLGVGSVTRLLRFLSPLPKSYTCEIVLGVETSTLDAAGDVTATHAMSVSVDDVRAAARALTGDLLQVPPMVSAVSIGGKRLHELARQGIEVEREARPVTVHSFDVEATDDPLVYRAAVECSSGTYVRSLAADLGHALGGGAHLRSLRRTAIGPFTESIAHPLESPALLPPTAAVDHLPRLDVPRDRVAVGGIVAGDAADGDGPWAVVDGDELLAVYERSRDRIKPAVVLLRTT
jgi:tRNA pseudouridine55 synthase